MLVTGRAKLVVSRGGQRYVLFQTDDHRFSYPLAQKMNKSIYLRVYTSFNHRIIIQIIPNTRTSLHVNSNRVQNWVYFVPMKNKKTLILMTVIQQLRWDRAWYVQQILVLYILRFLSLHIFCLISPFQSFFVQ